MRRWTPILALCLVVVAPALARAAVQFKGLQFSSQGTCVADVSADGMLDLHNLGSSGQDGVSIDCTHMDGAFLAFSGQVSGADVGCALVQTYRCALGTLPPGAALKWSRTNATITSRSVDFSFSCDPSLSSSATQVVTLYRAGVAAYSAVVDASLPVSVAIDPATGGCPLPAMCTGLKKTTEVIEWREAGQASMSVSVGGHTEDCDDFTVSRALSVRAEDCDGRACDLSVVATPVSSLSHVRCSDGACRALDHWVQGAGGASVSVSVDASSSRRLKSSGIGSSGQDGVSILSRPGSGGGGGGGTAVAVGDVDGDGYAADCAMSPPSLSFDPAVDDGASATVTVVGRYFVSATGVPFAASVPLSVSIGSQSSGSGAGRVAALQVSCDHASLGSTSEWATVLSHGVVVASARVTAGSSVSVTAPAGGPPQFAISSMGASRGDCCRGHVIIMKTPQDGARGPASAASASSLGDGSCPMEVSFRCDRVFAIGGQPPVVGDELVMSGDETGTYSGTFQVTLSTCSVRCPNPGSPLSSLALLGFGAASSDVIQPVVGGGSITAAHAGVSIPFSFVRADATPVRAFSVRFHLSSELQAGAPFVTEGDYLSSVAGTQLFVTDNGGGSYTVDCGIMGPVCGATGSGQLFSLQLAAAAGVSSGMGSVVVDAVTVRDCSNQPVPASAGAAGFVPVQLVAPPPVSSLSAVQVKSGNPQPSSTTGVQLAWAPLSMSGSSVQAFRKGYDYYQAQSALAPASPADAVANGWSSASCSSGQCSSTTCSSGACVASGMLDQPPSRDYLYYVIFVRDAFGNASPCSNMTTGTLDYHLGDVSDGHNACTGDDHVDIADVSLLGSHYGSSVAAGSAYSCLDVGPTTDFSVDGRPLRDGKVGFEDFMMFAINFSVVSAPQYAARPMAAATDAVRLTVPATLPAVGSTFDAAIAVDGSGSAQGMSVRLDYDHAVLEQVGVANGSLLDAQGRAGLVLSSGPGSVDAALLGAGPGIAGSGELARVTFRVLSGGEARLAITGVSARDVANHPVPVAGVDAGAVADARTGLGFLFPNPFQQAVEIRLSLRRDGPAKLAIYDVAGRRVRLLLDGVQPAGGRTVSWDGRDDAGLKLAPGAYLVRLEAAGRNETRTVRLVR